MTSPHKAERQKMRADAERLADSLFDAWQAVSEGLPASVTHEALHDRPADTLDFLCGLFRADVLTLARNGLGSHNARYFSVVGEQHLAMRFEECRANYHGMAMEEAKR